MTLSAPVNLPTVKAAPAHAGTQVLDYTATSTAAACLRRFYYAYERRLERPEPNLPMAAGSAAHAGLEVLYEDGWRPERLPQALEALRAAWEEETQGLPLLSSGGKHSYLTLGHLEEVLKAYVAERTAKPTALERSKPVGAGVEGVVVFEWPNRDGSELLRVGGKIDLPVEFAGQSWIVDHKWTTGWVNDFWASRFRLAHQFRIYAAALQHLHGIQVAGAYVNAVHMGTSALDDASKWKTRKSSFTKLFGPYQFTQSQLEETWSWLKAHGDIIDICRQTGVWPQNEGACGDYGGCDFMEICEAAPVTRESRIRRSFRQWTSSGVLVSGADGKG